MQVTKNTQIYTGRRIIAITMVKNEMDVIESFVRHTLGFADALIVCDHQSTDRTRAILGQLQREGLPITIHTEYRAEYRQSEVMSALLEEAAVQQHADYILPLDVDEFLIPEQPGTCRALIEKLSPDHVYGIHWRRYVPAEPGQHAETFLLDQPLLRRMDWDNGYKCIVGGEAARRFSLQLIQGNHYTFFTNAQAETVSVEQDMTPLLSLAHFYWRSTEQFRTKIAVGWLNIAAKYSVDTPSGGGYRCYQQRLFRGEDTPWQELLPDPEPVDLHGRVPMPALRYSRDVTPDAWRNLLAASEALAESFAAFRAEQQGSRLTSVVPFLGDEQAFLSSLLSVLQQTYRDHQILMPVLRGTPSAAVRQAVAGEARAAWVEPGAAGDVFSALAAQATGDYVQWVLPGETIQPIKAARMVTSMANQDADYAMFLTNADTDDFVSVVPYLAISAPAEDNVAILPRPAFWRELLCQGKYPSSGLSGLLIRRDILDHRVWLREGFAEGRPVLLKLWQILLREVPEDGAGRHLGLLHSDYAGPFVELSLVQLAQHQIDWWELLHEDRALLSDEEWTQALERLRQNGITLLSAAVEQGLDTTAPLWQAYQTILLQI